MYFNLTSTWIAGPIVPQRTACFAWFRGVNPFESLFVGEMLLGSGMGTITAS